MAGLGAEDSAGAITDKGRIRGPYRFWQLAWCSLGGLRGAHAALVMQPPVVMRR